MDVLAVVLLIIVLFVVISIKISITNKMERIDREIIQLREQLTKSIVARPPAETPPAQVVPSGDPGKWKPAYKVYEETVKPPEAKPEPAST